MTTSKPFTAQEHQRIHDAVAAVEQSTAADLDIVVVRVSDRYSLYPLLWAGGIALALTGLAVLLRPTISARLAFALELMVLALLTILLDWLPIRLKLVPQRVKRAHARQLAHREFAAHHTRGGIQRNRILLFVSLGERYVEIIADHVTYAAVEGRLWEQMVNEFTTAVRSGQITDGVLGAIKSCGEVLRTRHPASSGQ